MKIVFLGSPGSGKGTQAQRLAKELNFKLISTGDLLRKAIEEKTLLGKQAFSYVKNGDLVPDDIMQNIIKENINNCENFIFDGFPRTLQQAEMLNTIINIEKVFYFNCPTNIIISRLSSRRICPNCTNVYNLITNKPLENQLCDKCKTKLILREDDKIDVIQKRIETYEKQALGLLNFYKDILQEIDATQPVEDIYNKLKWLIKNQ